MWLDTFETLWGEYRAAGDSGHGEAVVGAYGRLLGHLRLATPGQNAMALRFVWRGDPEWSGRLCTAMFRAQVAGTDGALGEQLAALENDLIAMGEAFVEGDRHKARMAFYSISYTLLQGDDPVALLDKLSPWGIGLASVRIAWGMVRKDFSSPVGCPELRALLSGKGDSVP